jgi:CubicO group peptidase (beta-lactamase class C family)
LAFGLRDVEANLPMETNTLFRIASMSKLVTSIGLMTLVDKGAVGLDDPVSRFIPEFAAPTVITPGDRNRKTRPSTKEITIRHLLTHTSDDPLGMFDTMFPFGREA